MEHNFASANLREKRPTITDMQEPIIFDESAAGLEENTSLVVIPYTHQNKDMAEVTVQQNSFFGSLALAHFLLAGVLFLLGMITGYFLAYFLREKKIKSLERTIEDLEKQIEIARKGPAEAGVSTDPVEEVEVVSTVPEQDDEPWQTNLVRTLKNAMQELQAAIGEVQEETRIVQVVQRSLKGLSDKYPGLLHITQQWEELQGQEQLDISHVLHGLNEIEVRKGLPSLYAVSKYPGLSSGIYEYYQGLGVDVGRLQSATMAIFDGLKNYARVEFDLPEFGVTFNENRYRLIDKNFGQINDIDSFALMKLLDARAEFSNPQPVIDVEELALISQPDATGITLNYPARTTVGYYTKS